MLNKVKMQGAVAALERNDIVNAATNALDGQLVIISYHINHIKY